MRIVMAHSDEVETSDAIEELLSLCDRQLDGEVPAAGLLFAWHMSGQTTPLWVGAGLGLAGAAVLFSWRVSVIDPVSRTITTRRGWLVFASSRRRDFAEFESVSIARTAGTKPSFCVEIRGDEPVRLPTQGRGRKQAATDKCKKPAS